MKRALQILGVLAVIVAIVWICAFKIADVDFFWHVAAGRLMVQTGEIIRTDPFAYTRVGMPYHSIHEWLAQIIFFLVFHAWGATGVILLRTALVAITFLLLLSIDRDRVWITAPLAILGAALALPGFVDRPQLFTYVLFTAMFVMALRSLDLPAGQERTRRRILLGMALLEVLWVNLHGGAAILGVVITGALVLQRLIHLRMQSGFSVHHQEIRWLMVAAAGALGALLLSPAGTGNLSYLASLMNDRTVSLIKEWAPRPLGAYLRDLWFLWFMVIGLLFWTRRHIVFSILVLLVLGVLSRIAFRHEMLFVFAAVGLIIEQLRWNGTWVRWMDGLLRRRLIAVAMMLGALLLTGFVAVKKSEAFVRPMNLSGYGTVEPARGAVDFLDREGITGPLFNMDWGGYIEYRDYPKRKVFYDGRNVDFGYPYMRAATDAAQDSEKWRSLEQKYHFTHAVLYYDPTTDIHPLPYIGLLQEDPTWVLTYLDDWMAVYLKVTPAQQEVIARDRYTLLTPEVLQTGSILDQLTGDQGKTLERELLRAIKESPDSLKPRLLLARLYALAHLNRDAASLLLDASQRFPGRYEPVELLAGLFAAEEHWAEAGALYEKAVELAGDDAAGIDYAALADVFERAGDAAKAALYRSRAER